MLDNLIMQLHLPEYFLADILVTVAFGFIAIVLLIIGYRLFDWMTPGLPFDATLKSGNVAAAIVIASFILGLCYVITRVIGAVLGT